MRHTELGTPVDIADWKHDLIIDGLNSGEFLDYKEGPYAALGPSHLGSIVRSHWAVENSLHWIMDMIFRDDECRGRTDYAAANFTTIRHIALNLLRTAKGKDSLRLRRKVAAWDDDFLASLIAA